MNENKAGHGTAAIGVDGGVSTLNVAVRDGEGKITQYECLGANPNLVGMAEFVTRLNQSVHEALAVAGVDPCEIASAGFGLSGVDRESEIGHLRNRIRSGQLENCRKIWIGNDGVIALRLGAGVAHGIAIVAGTGSIAYVRTAGGREARVGGWGDDLGDEGSGFWIGHRALQSVCRMCDGRLKRSILLDQILKHLGLTKPEELIPWSSDLRRETFKKLTAELYPVVSRCASEGDHAARQAILLGVGHLVQHAVTAEKHLRRLEREEAEEQGVTPDKDSQESESVGTRTKIVCSGGLFQNDQTYFETFVHQLKRQKDIFDPVRLAGAPSLGALAMGEEAEPMD